MKAITGIAILGAVLLAASAFHARRVSVKTTVTSPVRTAFASWMKQYKMQFATPTEFNYRLGVFAQTLNRVQEHNSKKLSYTLEVNAFAHFTLEEFLAKYTGLNIPKNYERNIVSQEPMLTQQATVDWVSAGAVNAIKNQGNCGSCWAFSATAAMEGIWKISGNALQNQAEQQLVDCSTSYGNQGCNGGWMDYAFKYVIAVGGQMSTSSYPYKTIQGACQFDASKIIAKIKSFADVPQGSCSTLLAFATKQPTSVAIAVDSLFQAYKSGVYSDTTCGTGLNHGVTVVGFGTDSASNKQYWNVRNSWGASWGQNGYIWMDRNVSPKTGICGICQAASAPSN